MHEHIWVWLYHICYCPIGQNKSHGQAQNHRRRGLPKGIYRKGRICCHPYNLPRYSMSDHTHSVVHSHVPSFLEHTPFQLYLFYFNFLPLIFLVWNFLESHLFRHVICEVVYIILVWIMRYKIVIVYKDTMGKETQRNSGFSYGVTILKLCKGKFHRGSFPLIVKHTINIFFCMNLKLFSYSHSLIILDDRILLSSIILDERALYFICQVLYLMTELYVRKKC